MSYCLRATALALLLTAGAAAAAELEGVATWYGPGFHGRTMANGQVFDMYDPTTTASRDYPFGTWLLVTNPQNGKKVYVQVRDRGAFAHALDLSYAAFHAIAEPSQMQVRVRYQVIKGPGVEPPAAPPAPPLQTVETARRAPADESPPAPRSGPVEPPPDRYQVRTGDTLFSVARRFGLGVGDLAKLNELENANLLRPGQILELRPPPPPALSFQEYEVQVGDQPWAIARRHNLTTIALLELNGLKPEDLIFPGQRLRLPRPERWHTVESGESLGGIATRFGTTVEALLRLNQLKDPDLIQPGLRLQVG